MKCQKVLCPEILYGQAKAWKPIINHVPSFRILSGVTNARPNNLVEFLVPILSPLPLQYSDFRDFFRFDEEVTKTNSVGITTSLDIESLFANIFLDGISKNCFNEFFPNNSS